MGSFGDRLKKEREQRSISLDDIALSTKIGTRMLRALEDEKFEQLPGGIFNKGFVRAYARHLGLDEEQTIADYMAALGASQLKASEEAPALPKPELAPKRRGAVVQGGSETSERTAEIPWGLLALALLLIALAFASWSYYHRNQRDDSRKTSIPARTETTTTPTVNADSPGPRPSALSDPQAVTSAKPSAPPPVQAVRQPSSHPLDGTQAVQQASESQRLTPAAGTFTVLLRGNEESEECWVSITVDGKPAVEAILSAPTQKEIQASNEVVIKAGSVGALDFFFNGRKIPPQGEYGIVKTLTFRSDGLQPPRAKPAALVPR
jgi:cytoskeleton protein RodZ